MIAMAIYLCALVMFLAAPSKSSATEKLTDGSSSKQLRIQTVNSLPYHQLNQQTKDKIANILNKPSIYRRLPVTAIHADPDYFRFLVRYPEVIVNIWQLMGVTKMSTERTGPYSISTDDGAGTISSLELLYGTDKLHIFYGTGSYEGPIFKRKLNGKCVLVLRSENKFDANGKPVTISQLDVFLKVENATAGLIAKTIQPLVGTTADHNFVESLKFVQRLNETTSKNGPGVQRMGARLKIDSKVRLQFNEIIDLVFQRAINASAPADVRTPVRPASTNTQYSTPVQPPRNLNPQNATSPQRQTGYQAPVYQQLHDVGQFQSGYRNGGVQTFYPFANGLSQYRAASSRSHQLTNGHQMPARGHQAPLYVDPISGIQAFQFQHGFVQPVQASYQFGPQPQSSIQTASGWLPRQ